MAEGAFPIRMGRDLRRVYSNQPFISVGSDELAATEGEYGVPGRGGVGQDSFIYSARFADAESSEPPEGGKAG
jgi:hypothetical protein